MDFNLPSKADKQAYLVSYGRRTLKVHPNSQQGSGMEPASPLLETV